MLLISIRDQSVYFMVSERISKEFVLFYCNYIMCLGQILVSFLRVKLIKTVPLQYLCNCIYFQIHPFYYFIKCVFTFKMYSNVHGLSKRILNHYVTPFDKKYPTLKFLSTFLIHIKYLKSVAQVFSL